MVVKRLLFALAAVALAPCHAAWVGGDDGAFRPSEFLTAASSFIASSARDVVSFASSWVELPVDKPGAASSAGRGPSSPVEVQPVVAVMVAKLQHVRVTSTLKTADALGGVTVDAAWLDAAGLFAGQKVEVTREATGAMFATTIRAGERGSGTFSVDSAAAAALSGGCAPAGSGTATPAALGAGEALSVVAYGQMTREQYGAFKPRVLLFGGEAERGDGSEAAGGGGAARGGARYRLLRDFAEGDDTALQSPPLGEPGASGDTTMQSPPLGTPDVTYL